MIVEISLTRSLAKLLGFDNLKPSDNRAPSFNHFYADVITKNRQKTVMFYNTENGWITVEYAKRLRKDFLYSFKEAVKEMLVAEGIKVYIANNFINDIDDVVFSLTSNSSFVAKMSSRKKDFHFFYERYYDAPDAKRICFDRLFNSWIVKNNNPVDNMDYIIPFEEMGYYLINNYIDKEIEEKDHASYYKILDEEFSYSVTPMDLSNKSDEEIKRLNYALNKNNYFRVSIPAIRAFYAEHDRPTLEDCFEFIYSRYDLASVSNHDEEIVYIRLFNLDERMFKLYKRFFNRKYETRLKK